MKHATARAPRTHYGINYDGSEIHEYVCTGSRGRISKTIGNDWSRSDSEFVFEISRLSHKQTIFDSGILSIVSVSFNSAYFDILDYLNRNKMIGQEFNILFFYQKTKTDLASEISYKSHIKVKCRDLWHHQGCQKDDVLTKLCLSSLRIFSMFSILIFGMFPVYSILVSSKNSMKSTFLFFYHLPAPHGRNSFILPEYGDRISFRDIV